MVAQLDRVIGYEPIGRGFESLPLHQDIKTNGIPLVFYFALKHEICSFKRFTVFTLKKTADNHVIQYSLNIMYK